MANAPTRPAITHQMIMNRKQRRLKRGKEKYISRGAYKMIVGTSIEDLEIPHEPGNTIGIRQLSGLEMDEAEAINSSKALKRSLSLGNEALASLRETPRDTSVVSADIDPIALYDHEYILVQAIVRWDGNYYRNLEVNADNKKKLDKPTKDWLVKEIIDRNYIPLVKSTTSEISTNEDTSQEI